MVTIKKAKVRNMKLRLGEVAQACGLSLQQIKGYVMEGKLKYVSESQKKIDTQDPHNIKFFLSRDINPNLIIKGASGVFVKNPEDDTEKSIINYSGIPEKMLNMTIKDLIMNYGSLQDIKQYVEILKKIFDAQKVDTDIQVRRGELLPRELFLNLKTYIDLYHAQIFDFADGFCVQAIPILETDTEEAKIKIPLLMKENFTKLSESAKKTLDRELSKYDQSRNIKRDEDEQ